MFKVLTIAGSDSSGGAGIQGDLKTITTLGAYGMSVITALTAQNTMGIQGVLNVPPGFIALQLDAILTDLHPHAVKIGMVSCEASMDVIAQKLIQYACPHVVLDPVMISTSGTLLLEEDAIQALTHVLFPLAELITPNIPEATSLSGIEIYTKEDMILAAKTLQRRFNISVLIKGGHLNCSADDLLATHDNLHWFKGPRLINQNTHGTGCTLSSAIATYLASGRGLIESITAAKQYVSAALNANLDLGSGNGPLHHSFMLKML